MSSPPRMQDLFAAARDDAPSDLVRDQVWGRVAAATAAPAGAAAAAKAAAAAPSGAKLLVTGLAIGAATAALAAVAIDSLADGPNASTAGALRAPAVVASDPAAGARLAEPAPRGRAAPATEAATPAAAPPHAEASTPSVGQHAEARGATHGEASALAEEARLVTEARMALVRGEPERALALARSTRWLPARALEPEELALEARALRALGRADEALATELTLRRSFPSHALSR